MITNGRRFLHLHKNWKVRQTFNFLIFVCLQKYLASAVDCSKTHAQITTNNTKHKTQLFSLAGLFKESRHVDCADSEGNANDPELCDDSKKPEAVRECESENEEVNNISKISEDRRNFFKILIFFRFLRFARIFGLLRNGVFVHQNARMWLEFKREWFIVPAKMEIWQLLYQRMNLCVLKNKGIDSIFNCISQKLSWPENFVVKLMSGIWKCTL